MTPRPPALRVLVIDDYIDAADTLASLLSLLHCQVEVAYSGDEGLAMGDAQQPDLVILDLCMPIMDGFETARRVRERSWGRRAVIAAVSVSVVTGDPARASCGDIDLQLAKPISLNALLDVLAHVRST